MAEMEGFEPPHALRRLADFESAPFSHLGTSPQRSYYISEGLKNQYLNRNVSQTKGAPINEKEATEVASFFMCEITARS